MTSHGLFPECLADTSPLGTSSWDIWHGENHVGGGEGGRVRDPVDHAQDVTLLKVRGGARDTLQHVIRRRRETRHLISGLEFRVSECVYPPRSKNSRFGTNSRDPNYHTRLTSFA